MIALTTTRRLVAVSLLRRLHGITKAGALALLLERGIRLLHVGQPLGGAAALRLTAANGRALATGSSASGHIYST